MNDERLYDILVEAAKLMGMKIMATARYKCLDDSPSGVICFVMVDQSFLYCHTYADEGYMSVRVFTCGDADAYKGWEFIKKSLGIKDFRIKEIKLVYE
ncbi:MAG: hypothetical protein DRP15_03660 [Candidatus Aenigmatarchaeota archaeon]|nr:MAG: hypothetical protein DRP15_03660 [Candidatus Aenigmarchaeota archaeon]